MMRLVEMVRPDKDVTDRLEALGDSCAGYKMPDANCTLKKELFFPSQFHTLNWFQILETSTEVFSVFFNF